jgi:hypothetical protein
MDNDQFDLSLAQHLAAIRLCLEQHLRTPALALIYVGIDVMANISQRDKEQANRHDFVYWSEKYMNCSSRLGVSGLDLYAARCGVLHSYTSDSGLSRRRHARRIFYTWGNKTSDEPNAVLHRLGLTEKMVKIEELSGAFEDGVSAFRTVRDHRPDLAASVRAKARYYFADMSEFPGVEL